MKIKILFLIILSSFLCSCTEDTSIHFKESLVLDYDSKDSPLSLIEKIGNTKVEDDMIENNTLVINNTKLTCNDIDTKTEGIYNVEIKTSDPNNPIYKIQVVVKDISAPTIKLKNLTTDGKIEINKSQLSSLDLSSFVDVKDNLDSSPTTQITTDKSITSAGTYTITITATDKNGNKSDIKIPLHVKEDEKKQDPTNGNSNKSSNNSNSNSSETPNKTPSPPTPPKDKPTITLPNKKFLFGNRYSVGGVEYYCDWNSVTMICSSYISKSGKSGGCYPIESNGVTSGMEARFK